MKNFNKFIIALLAIAVLVGGFWGVKQYFSGEKGNKTIVITIKDDSTGKTIVNKKSFKTDAKNLGDFLEEKKDTLKVEMSTSKYGRFVNGIEGIKTTDMNKGPWWMYGFKSPSKNIDYKIGQAPGVDDIGLSDKDEVEFLFTNNMAQ